MIYRAIGIMSGSSLDGLDIVFAEIIENGGQWSYQILHADCLAYTEEWIEKLKDATTLSALDYQLLHTQYGHYIGRCVNQFISTYQLQYKVALIASHGHTAFHIPSQKMTAQLGDGAAIAAVTQLPVVSDLRAMDIALSGQGAPIVPIGEQLLFPQYQYLLNIGGIANISIHAGQYLAFDICAANRVLNMLANEAGRLFDPEGQLAQSGSVHTPLLEALQQLDYYTQPAPKSLANSFGTDVVYPLIKQFQLSTTNALCTYAEHIALQVKNAVAHNPSGHEGTQQMLITGGGASNTFLTTRLQYQLAPLHIETTIPDLQLVQYKEALIMALIGVLRWREECNVLNSATGATRNSVGGAFWMGQES